MRLPLYIQLSTIIIAISLIPSCKKEQEYSNIGLNEITLKAGWDSETKTVLQEDGSVFWSPSDEISVFVGKGSNGGYKFTSTNTTPAASVDFKGTVDTNTDNCTYYAIYPYDESISFDGVFHTTIPSEQYATAGSFSKGQLISVAKSSNGNLSFKNACGGIKFSVFNKGISKVVFGSYDNECRLAGDCFISITNDSKIDTTFVNFSGTNSITVFPSEGKYFEVGKYYYAALPPKVIYNFYVNYYTDTSVATYSYDYSGKESWPVIERSKVKRLYEKDKDLTFRKKYDTYAYLKNTYDIIPEGIDKTAITEVIFHTSSETTTNITIPTYSLLDEQKNVYFELKGTVAHFYTQAEVYVLDRTSYMFCGFSNLRSVDLSMFDTSNATAMDMMFSECISLEELDLSNFDTSNVTSMVGMFQCCSNLKKLNISNFSSASLCSTNPYGASCGAECIFNKLFNLTTLDLGNFELSGANVSSALLHIARYSKNCAIRCTSGTRAALCSDSSMLDTYEKYITWVLPGEDMPELEPKSDTELYCSTDYHMDKTFRVLNKATEGNGVNVIILGEAYSDRLIANGKYDRDAESAMEHIFSIEPFKSHRHLFNVYQVYAVSKNETIDGNLVFDYFNAELQDPDARYGPNGLLAYITRPAIEQYENVVAHNIKNRYTTLLLVNDERRHGFAWIEGSYTNDDLTKGYDYAANLEGRAFVHTYEADYHYLVCHEFGHAFAALFEEYVDIIGVMESWESEHMKNMHALGWYRNVDFTSDPETILWSKFLKDSRYDESKVSIVEGGRYSNEIWRSIDNSMMGSGGEFSVPAREIIYKTISKTAYGDDWAYDYETFVQQDLMNVYQNKSSKPYYVPKTTQHQKPFMNIEKSKTSDNKNRISVMID